MCTKTQYYENDQNCNKDTQNPVNLAYWSVN